MSRQAVVFFSHSSADNVRAIELCAAIEKSAAVRTTIDLRDLRQGQPWKRQLYRWMARCDAGFLLLTKAVMQQPGWVLQEATLLNARQLYFGAERFPLLVVVDPDARTEAQWQSLFAPLGLREIQGISSTSTPQEIAAAVAEACGAAVTEGEADFYSRLRDQIGFALEPFAANQAFTRALLTKLAVQDAYWRSIVGDDDVLAGSLTQRVCEANDSGAIGTYGGLDALLQAFAGKGNAEQRGNVLHVLRPYWVNLGAALQLAATMRRPPGQRLCALTTSQPSETPLLCIDRFFGPYNELPTVLQVTGGTEFGADLTAQVIEAWNDKWPGLAVRDSAALDARLRASSVAVVVLLPPLAVAAPARAVAAALPHATFIVPVLHGSADLTSADWHGIETLEPARDAASEDLYFQHYAFASGYAA